MSSGNDEVEFALRLDNQIGANAQAAVRDLEAVDAAMKRTGKSEREVRAAMKDLANSEKEAADEAKRLGKEQEAAAKKHADEHSAAMKRVGESSAKATDGLAEFAAKGAISLAVVTAGLIVAAEDLALKASEFKDKTLKAFEIIDGTRSSAAQTFKELTEAASGAGLPTAQVTAYYKELRTAGYTAKEAKTLMSAAMDIGAVGETGQDKAFIKAIEGIRAKGTATVEALNSLKEAGIADPDAFYGALAKMEGGTKGKSAAQLKAMLEAKQIDSDTAINAILGVVQQKFDNGGALGTAANEMASGSLTGQLQGLKNEVEGIFADTAVKGPMLDALKSLRELLGEDTESGQKIRKLLGDAFTTIGDAISKITPDDIEKAIGAAVTLADAIGSVGKAFGKTFGKTFEKLVEPLGKFLDDSEGGSSKLDVLVGALEIVGAAVGRLGGTFLGTLLALPTGLANLYGDLKDIFDRIPHSWDELEKWWDDLSLVDVGENLIDGLWDGIKSTWRSMLKKFGDLVDLLPDAAKKALGIASPSRVMRELGEFAGEGFTLGIEGENDNARGAMVDLVTPPPAPIIPAPSVAVSPMVRGGGSITWTGDLIVQVQGTNATPQDIETAGRRGVFDALRGIGEEMGVFAEDEEAA